MESPFETGCKKFLEFRAVIDYATAAKIAFADDLASLLDGDRAAHRARDRILSGSFDLRCFGFLLAWVVQRLESYSRRR
jgi:hypothetical protein